MSTSARGDPRALAGQAHTRLEPGAPGQDQA